MLAILSKLKRIASQTLHRAHPGCDLPRRLPRAPCVPSRIVQERSALNSPINRMTRPAIAKKTIESRRANRPISPWRAVAFHPVAAELACVLGVAPWGGGSELGGGDEGRRRICAVAIIAGQTSGGSSGSGGARGSGGGRARTGQDGLRANGGGRRSEGAEGGLWGDMPQSKQSVPSLQSLYLEPGPPSSHTRSKA